MAAERELTERSFEAEIVRPVGTRADVREPVALAMIEAAIRDARDIEEWQRDVLLAEVRSLDEFYRRHRSS